jgi:hypothetical protein
MRQSHALGESIASPDRGDHGARDDWSDARDAHEPFASGVLLGKLLDLAGQTFDALIE